jgi:ABC-2 type transport system permease protein
MTTLTEATTTGPAVTPPASEAPRRPRRGPGRGWWTVAAKELADHLSSLRFLLLFLILGLAGLAAVNSASDAIRDAAANASEAPSVFLALFTLSPEELPAFASFVTFLGPILGIAFGFDAINTERAERTLPRLVAQPIHRDAVINGKFVAGLLAIALALVVVIAIVAGFGIFRLGTVPDGGDFGRLIAYALVSLAYIAFWLALAILLSVLIRRPATAALTAIALWLVFTLFAGLITSTLADAVGPDPSDSPRAALDHARLELNLSRVSPTELYEEATGVLLNPTARTTGILTLEQVDRAVPNPLPLTQSLLLAWPQIVVLVAGSVVLFALAYILFMRQEIRA